MISYNIEFDPPAPVLAVQITGMVTGLPFVILGRDWINQYYIHLNGPETWFLVSQTSLPVKE
jgi:hypothetical protein